jgi:cyanobactin maturation PatA/PatG family protease
MVATTSSISHLSALPQLEELWAETKGDPNVCVAVLDGPVDLLHPCFKSTNLTRLQTLVSDIAGKGLMSGHGTHITSVIFGQHGSPISGIAPGCRGLIVPVFADGQTGPLSQLDLARAINQAVEQGAHIINISGGQLSQSGEADPILANAVRFCNNNGVLIVAAAGNDACRCLHVPAALPSVLAVGAMNAQGVPLDFSNWGEAYQTQGILAPGENVLGAIPGGGVATKSGTSFATPIVSGIVALLLSIQLKQGEKLNPHAIRDAILKSALPCNPELNSDCRRFLAGRLNIPGAYALIRRGETQKMSKQNPEMPMVKPSETICANPAETSSEGFNNSQLAAVNPDSAGLQMAETTGAGVMSTPMPTANGMVAMPNAMAVPAMPNANGLYYVPSANGMGMYVMPYIPGMAATPSQMATPLSIAHNAAAVTPSNVVASEGCSCGGNAPRSLVYAIGVLGYDFGTEARRDSFKQLMPGVDARNPNRPHFEGDTNWQLSPESYAVPAQPFDARQMVNYLLGPLWQDAVSSADDTIIGGNSRNTQQQGRHEKYKNLSEAESLIWTLNLELTPIYAIEPKGSFASDVYKELSEFLAGQISSATDPEYVERVSIPGILTGRTVRLFSGQVVPVIEPVKRGMYSWRSNALIDAVIDKIGECEESVKEGIRYSLKHFLQRIYYDLRNLGQTSQERALNHASANIFQLASVLVDVLRDVNRPTTTDANAPRRTVALQLDSIDVERSPFCRMDSDCWDVKIRFFDPENDRRARKVIRYTIDVSDVIPVTLGQPRVWDVS